MLDFFDSPGFVYESVSRIANRLEEKGFVKNIYKKRRERFVRLIKDIKDLEKDKD